MNSSARNFIYDPKTGQPVFHFNGQGEVYTDTSPPRLVGRAEDGKLLNLKGELVGYLAPSGSANGTANAEAIQRLLEQPV